MCPQKIDEFRTSLRGLGMHSLGGVPAHHAASFFFSAPRAGWLVPTGVITSAALTRKQPWAGLSALRASWWVAMRIILIAGTMGLSM